MRWIALILAGVVLSGCKLAVLVSSGGDVTSLSGTRDCAGPNFCEFDIDSSGFSETFTAVPRPGFEFVKWNSGGGFLCEESASQQCTVSLPAEPLGSYIIASYDTGFIMPVFKDVGFDTDGDGIFDRQDDDDDNDGVLDVDDLCPLDPNPNCGILIDNVVIGDRQWAQVKLFDGLTWEEVNAVCPDGNCISGETLNGWDMTGWKWASVDEVKLLFNTLIGSLVLYPGVDTYSVPCDWNNLPACLQYLGITWTPSDFCSGGNSDPAATAYFHGFEAISSSTGGCTWPSASLMGHVRDTSGDDDSVASAGFSYSYISSNRVGVYYTASGGGAWFYK